MTEDHNPIATWDCKHDAELESQDRETADAIAQALDGTPLNTPEPTGLHDRLMGQLRHKATAECVRQLDITLQAVNLGTTALPTEPLDVDAFGRLSFKRIETTNAPTEQQHDLAEDLEIRLRLHDGKLVDRKALLEYDQHLWSAYTHPSSLAIMLLDTDTERLEVAEGPTVDNGDLVWRASPAPGWVPTGCATSPAWIVSSPPNVRRPCATPSAKPRRPMPNRLSRANQAKPSLYSRLRRKALRT
jgi:hypothetical protein